MNTNCHFCHKPVAPGVPGTAQKVTGWTTTRIAGGANAVRLAQPHDEFAHSRCIDLAKNGYRFGQQALDLGDAA